MTKQEILDWLKDMKKEDPKTYQLLLLTVLEQIQKDLGKWLLKSGGMELIILVFDRKEVLTSYVMVVVLKI